MASRHLHHPRQLGAECARQVRDGMGKDDNDSEHAPNRANVELHELQQVICTAVDRSGNETRIHVCGRAWWHMMIFRYRI
jgi:hypothetical protein